MCFTQTIRMSMDPVNCIKTETKQEERSSGCTVADTLQQESRLVMSFLNTCSCEPNPTGPQYFTFPEKNLSKTKTFFIKDGPQLISDFFQLNLFIFKACEINSWTWPSQGISHFILHPFVFVLYLPKLCFSVKIFCELNLF